MPRPIVTDIQIDGKPTKSIQMDIDPARLAVIMHTNDDLGALAEAMVLLAEKTSEGNFHADADAWYLAKYGNPATRAQVESVNFADKDQVRDLFLNDPDYETRPERKVRLEAEGGDLDTALQAKIKSLSS